MRRSDGRLARRWRKSAREGWGTPCVAYASEVKSAGLPPTKKTGPSLRSEVVTICGLSETNATLRPMRRQGSFDCARPSLREGPASLRM